MRIEFHPTKQPAHVWWAHWDGIEGNVLQREAVVLDSQYSAPSDICVLWTRR